MHVKDRLVAWRKREKMTQREAASLAGVSQSAWQSYEDAESDACPGVNAALAIAEVTKGEIPVTEWRAADASRAKRKAVAASKRVQRMAKAS